MAEGTKKVRFYNRLSGKLEEESIYGEGALRWAYYNPIGKLITKLIVKNPIVSRLYGWLMSRPSSRKKIRPFIEQYKVDTSEFLESPETYSDFNAFFYRELKPESRPIDDCEATVVFPADGRHLAYPNIQKADTIYAKGQIFNLEQFLGEMSLAHGLEGGTVLISRLCPVDYHRFHAPFSGVAMIPQRVGKSLYSVSPLALSQKLEYLIENRRWIIPFKLKDGRIAAVVVIGATFVGSAEFTFEPGFVEKGQELGYFLFGGSCVATVLPPGYVQLDKSLVEQSQNGVESYDLMGRPIGVCSR